SRTRNQWIGGGKAERPSRVAYLPSCPNSCEDRQKMPAYYRTRLADFIAEEPQAVIGQLQIKYAEDGFAQQYLTQTRAWAEVVPLLQAEARTLVEHLPGACSWNILLEFPLYRLQRRIDIVVLTTSIVVIESKVGEERFLASDERQVEEY